MQTVRTDCYAIDCHDKYSLLNSGNLLQHFQIQISEKWKIFSKFFSWHFLNLESILNIFRKKTALQADVFLNLRTPKNVRYMSKNSCLRWPFEKEHGKWSEILLKFERQHLYHIYWSLGRQFSWKIVSWWHDKCQDCFLTHWLPMASILFLTEGIFCDIFRCSYLGSAIIYFAFSKFRFNF